MNPKITNHHKLSFPLAIFLSFDDYDYDGRPNAISATRLLKPVKEIVLSMQNPDLVKEIDLVDLVPSRIGSAMHHWLERAWADPKTRVKACEAMGFPADIANRIVINPTVVTDDMIPVYIEQRSEKEINGFIVVGKFDMVLDGRLSDLKSGSVWGYIFGSNVDDHIKQGSIYRWLNENIVTEPTVGIERIFTDWSSTSARDKKDYPQSRVMSSEYQLLSVADTEKFIVEKLAMIVEHRSSIQADIPVCTYEELWEKPTVYKYFKTDKAKRATKVCDSMAEAEGLKAKNDCGRIDVFPGEVKACVYCSALPVCDQAKGYIATGKLKL